MIMDYEKKYRDLVEAVKELQEANPSDDDIQNWVKDNVPELKESEDEKIRKAIIEFFELQDDDTTYSFIPKKDILAWLEKQGGQKPVISDDALREGITHFRITQYQIDNWLKKYVELKCKVNLSNKVEPIFRIGDTLRRKGKDYTFIVDRIQGGYYHCDHNNGAFFPIEEQDKWELVEQNHFDKVEQEYHCNGVREPKEATGVLKQLLNKENYAWSEEDEAYRVDILVKLEPHITDDNFTDVQNWFKSIKDRVNLLSKQEWSEEDEYQINTILHGLDLKRELYKKEGNKVEEERYSTQYNWLKSLKNKYTWKPSKEQMDALETATSSLQSTALESLYKELKKLKD